MELNEWLTTAGHEHKLSEDAGRACLAHAIKSGEALIKAKTLVPHGRWLPTLEQARKDGTFTGTRQMAANYMRLASNGKRVLHLLTEQPDLSIRAALRELSGKDSPDALAEPKPKPDTADTEDQPTAEYGSGTVSDAYPVTEYPASDFDPATGHPEPLPELPKDRFAAWMREIARVTEQTWRMRVQDDVPKSMMRDVILETVKSLNNLLKELDS